MLNCGVTVLHISFAMFFVLTVLHWGVTLFHFGVTVLYSTVTVLHCGITVLHSAVTMLPCCVIVFTVVSQGSTMLNCATLCCHSDPL